MPVNHESVAALPTAGGADHQLLRDLLVRRMAYCLAKNEDSQDLVAVDPQSGATILVLIQNGRLYALDPLDTTTAHDGTTTLVSQEGKRYKLDDLRVPFAVLSGSLTAPPDSPAAEPGDSYLLLEPGTGDWAGLGPIVILTARGWESIDLAVGQFIHVNDENAYYHMDPSGDIVPGLGVGSISDGTLYPRHLLRGGDLVTFIVENQTTDTPPGSPSEGDAYIAASSSTGDWSGWDGSVVRYEAGAWRRYEPSEGWRVYDKDANQNYLWDGTNWREVALGYAGVQAEFTSGSTAFTAQGSNSQGYALSTTAPTQSQNTRFELTPEATVQADFADQRFEVEFTASITAASFPTNNGGDWILSFTLAAFIDSGADAVDWAAIGLSGQHSSATITFPANCHGREIRGSFEFTLGDTSSHTLKLFLLPRASAGVFTAASTSITLIRRRLTVRKKS